MVTPLRPTNRCWVTYTLMLLALFCTGRSQVGVSMARAWALSRTFGRHPSKVACNEQTIDSATRRTLVFPPLRGGNGVYGQDNQTPKATQLYATEPKASSNNQEQQQLDESTLAAAVAQPLLQNLASPKLKWKTFGGLSYMDTNDNSSGDSFFRVLFVLGGPGAGKGTQSELMSEHYPVVHLSVGELLRNEQTKTDSPHRELIEQTLVAGKIVPVEISLQLLEQAMRDQRDLTGDQLLYLVDGFPRNEDNLRGWCESMQKSTVLWGVLVYQCPLEVLEERILKRAKDSGRSDDNLQSLRKRFDTFERDTVPIVETLRRVSTSLADKAQWSVIDISGDQVPG